MRRLGFEDYRELVRRSAEEPEWFWPEVVADLGLEFVEPWSSVVDLSRGPEWATWFVGGELPMRAILEEARREAPSREHVLVAPWEDALAESPGRLAPLPVDSEHPYLLAYTSGTTGRPKGVVHVQGGFLVSIAREAAYQADLHPGDPIHFVTDMGWIMGPWTVVGAGALGCPIVFAEGAPDWPS